MRHTFAVIAFLLVAGLAAGWALTDRTAAAAPNVSETAAVQGDDTPAPDAKDTEQTVKDYSYAQKAKFVADMKKALAKTKKEMDRLSAKVDKSNGQAKAEAKTQLAAASAKWAEAKKQLDKAETATETTWDDVKGSFKKAYDDMNDSFEKTRQWFSDKFAS